MDTIREDLSMEEIISRAKMQAEKFAETCLSLADVEGSHYHNWWQSGDERALRAAIVDGVTALEKEARESAHKDNHAFEHPMAMGAGELSILQAGEAMAAFEQSFNEYVQDNLGQRAAREITKRREAVTPEKRYKALKMAPNNTVAYFGGSLDPKVLRNYFAQQGLDLEGAREIAGEVGAIQTLRRADEQLGNYGIEEIRQENNVLYTYSNSGDACTRELFLLRAEGEFEDYTGFVISTLEDLSIHDPYLQHTLPPEL